MIITHSVHEMQAWSQARQKENKTVALVPTMGFLHEGHLSLIRIAREKADITVVSIFVNPTQFAPNEDLESYPRNFERDEDLCHQEHVDVIFYPSADEMYQPEHSCSIVESSLASTLCGSSRPTHFDGVCTVVAKLFNIVLPSVAVFGQKDAQQLRIIQQMTRDLNFPVEIVTGPIVREGDGLAMSSRNSRLTEEARQQAVYLQQSLEAAEKKFSDGVRDAQPLKEDIQQIIQQSPLARIDYTEIVDLETLQPVSMISAPCLIAVAVYFDDVRLIDNRIIEP